MPGTFDIEELRAFVVMADEGHFAESAGTLGISQPAVSQRIFRLENSLGFHLFTRTAQGAILTPCGERMLETARRCVESHGRMLREMDERRYSAGGRVRVWIEPSLADESLVRCLREPMDGVPGLELSTERRKVSWADQLRGLELDVVVCGSFLDHPEIPGIERTVLHQEPGLSVIWSPERIEYSSQDLSMDRLLSFDLIFPSPRWIKGVRSLFENWCSLSQQTCRGELGEVHSLPDAVKACQAGATIAVLPGNLSSGSHVFRSSALLSKALFAQVLPNAYQVGLFVRKYEASQVVLGATLRLRAALDNCLLQRGEADVG